MASRCRRAGTPLSSRGVVRLRCFLVPTPPTRALPPVRQQTFADNNDTQQVTLGDAKTVKRERERSQNVRLFAVFFEVAGTAKRPMAVVVQPMAAPVLACAGQRCVRCVRCKCSERCARGCLSSVEAGQDDSLVTLRGGIWAVWTEPTSCLVLRCFCMQLQTPPWPSALTIQKCDGRAEKCNKRVFTILAVTFCFKGSTAQPSVWSCEKPACAGTHPSERNTH